MCLSRSLAIAVAGIALVAASGASASAELIHRYSFNDGTAGDSVGSLAGTLFGTASVSGGSLVLGGGYAQLPSGIMPTNGTVTIEVWGAYTSSDNFVALFGFGSSADNALQMMPSSTNPPGSNGKRDQKVEIAWSAYEMGYASGIDQPYIPLIDGTLHHTALVIDGNTMTLYQDGADLPNPTDGVGTVVRTITDAGISTKWAAAVAGANGGSSSNYIGKSQWADPNLRGSITEFRVYNSALTAEQIHASYQLGPDAIPEPSSLFLTSIGLLGLLAYAWRKRK